MVLIAVNLFGISSTVPRHRARVRLDSAPDPACMAIVSLNVTDFPFTLSEDLFLNSVHVAGMERIDADDAVGGYFRNGGAAATLNPNARSRCVGCDGPAAAIGAQVPYSSGWFGFAQFMRSPALALGAR
ncbi:hypothetical protein ACFT2C_04395 [Promicromonospora sp. NPDC057138]|uniref:hypothetical protein n=1 Tax=Promicromonospora sp. NPDC057138 TaxID=3346031 RepID=UPI003634C0B6